MSASLCVRAATAQPVPRPHLVLQNTGGRPLCFSAHLVAASDDSALPSWARLRLALYEGAGFYVTEMRAEPWPAGRAWCRAAWHATMDEAVRDFEIVQPVPECPVGDQAGFAATDGMAFAIAWRARERAQMRAWRTEVGHFLHRLCETRTVAASDDCAHE